jgi:colicin import membrane protein
MPPPRTRPGGTPGIWIAATLAIAVHALFVLVLVFSINWQNYKPEPVMAELYAPPATAKVEVTPPQPPPPAPEPQPVKPEQKVDPVPPPKIDARPPPPSKAQIALKAKQEEDRRKQEQAERDRKDKERMDAEKRDSDKKKLEAQRIAEARDRQARESDALKAQAERERVQQQVQQQRSAADADYVRRIQSKIKGMVTLPPDMPGNPEVIFEIVQLPTGEIMDVQLRKSSGVRAYDEAMERAIIKSSPLPRPDTPELFRRNLTLKFRPLE